EPTQCGADPICEDPGFACSRTWRHDDELIASPSCRDVPKTTALTNALRNAPQRSVPRFMSSGVVDGLEPVYIDHEQRERDPIPPRQRKLVGEPTLVISPIVESGLRIDDRRF